jgi:hypothetical protein
VIALTFTGDAGPICATHRCEYAVSPGKVGVSGEMNGEMSQIARTSRTQ